MEYLPDFQVTTDFKYDGGGMPARIRRARAGNEQRSALYAGQRFRTFEVPLQWLGRTDEMTFRQFFEARNGQTEEFYWLHPKVSYLPFSMFCGIGDGSALIFQAPTLTVNGIGGALTGATSDSSGTFDHSTAGSTSIGGVPSPDTLVFSAPPADGAVVTCSGTTFNPMREFMLVRFSDPTYKTSLEFLDGEQRAWLTFGLTEVSP